MPSAGKQALLPGGSWCLVAREEPWGPVVVSRASAQGPGCCFPHRLAASAGSSGRRRCSAEKKVFSPGFLGKALGLGTQVSGPLSSCSLWCQAVSEGGGSEARSWVAAGSLSYLGRFRAVPVMAVSVVWQGALRRGPATPDAVQGAAQGAQARPEPELGLAGAPGVVGHALSSLAAGVQCSRLAEGHEQQTGGQQEEDAGQGNEHGQGDRCLHRAPRSASCEGTGALCAHGSCNRKGIEAQRQIGWTQARRWWGEHGRGLGAAKPAAGSIRAIL